MTARPLESRHGLARQDGMTGGKHDGVWGTEGATMPVCRMCGVLLFTVPLRPLHTIHITVEVYYAKQGEDV